MQILAGATLDLLPPGDVKPPVLAPDTPVRRSTRQPERSRGRGSWTRRRRLWRAPRRSATQPPSANSLRRSLRLTTVARAGCRRTGRRTLSGTCFSTRGQHLTIARWRPRRLAAHREGALSVTLRITSSMVGITPSPSPSPTAQAAASDRSLKTALTSCDVLRRTPTGAEVGALLAVPPCA